MNRTLGVKQQEKERFAEVILNLAHMGYEAYGKNRGWVTFDGRPMPRTLDECGEAVKVAWMAAAGAMAQGIYGNLALTFEEWRNASLAVFDDLNSLAAERRSSVLIEGSGH